MTAFLFGGAVALAGCEGPEGPPGLNGANGLDGTDGTDGTNGNNGTDGTNGTNGTNGANGADGVPGQDGQDYVSTKLFKNIDLAVTSVFNDGGALAVTFTAFDNGNPITNLTMASVRMMFNQYLPKANAYDNAVWSEDKFYERGSTAGADTRFVQDPQSLGTYTYTFLETIQEGITNDGVDPALPTQLAMRISSFETYNRVNAIYQITSIPTTDGAVATEVAAPVGEIVTTAACESCHGPRIGGVGHGGGYNKVEYCRNCHTQDPASTFDDLGVIRTFTEAGFDLRTMIHQIHSAYDHTAGGTLPGMDWTEVTYPQDTRNCNKCHNGTDGQFWNTLPTREACGSCHTAVNFATGAGHTGGAQANNANCQLCHNAAATQGYHFTENLTPNSPGTIAGAVNFEYQVNSVTVDAAGIATVNFAILADGAKLTTLATTYPPTGFTGGPSFALAYALPQDGVLPADVVDWNNRGRASAQPATVAITAAALTYVPADSTYNITLTAAPFPAGATMRTVALQGYFTQTSLALGRHTSSVVKTATGDTMRRAVVEVSGCIDCHEIFEGHGGNRVLTATTDSTSPNVCLLCHVPNLTSSGRTFNLGAYVPGSNVTTDATIAMFGNNAMLWPEDTNNFKDLIHGIHSSAVRGDAYEFVRIRSGTAYGFDWSEVKFPGDPSNCSKCHKGTSYAIDAIPAGALASTKVTDNGGAMATYTDVVAARASLPNNDDVVLAPVVAACNSCHNGAMLDGHMEMNGANFGMTRTQLATATPAQCAICHDSGSTADVQTLHGGLNP
ncbi:MAG: OmcA/MtrC family decaheme c-type cytochrome [Myxococcales bacterium]|nr:OmcA/MtrC family decaheme c-type cytochrome [Myxococcales bacterium]